MLLRKSPTLAKPSISSSVATKFLDTLRIYTFITLTILDLMSIFRIKSIEGAYKILIKQ